MKQYNSRLQSFLLIFLFSLGLSITTFAQNQTFAGFAINSEFLGNNTPRLGAGLTLEKKIKEHHGFETGVFYRNRISTNIVTIDLPLGENAMAVSTIYSSYVSVPLHYKYYSNLVNFSIGVNFDYFVGWTATSSNPNIKLESYSANPMLLWGISAKVSKSFRLSDCFILEPEIRLNPIVNIEPHTLSGGIGLIGKFDPSSIGKTKVK